MTCLARGDLAAPVLAALAKERPVRFYTGRNNKWQVRNECLAADAREIAAQRALVGLGSDAEDISVLAAARDFIAAAASAKAAYRSAKLAG